ncbi:zinc finger protein 687b isoform X1 [Larimichthys crocea]|uniref:zinc finger protein 687b isoform X1 n=1 Tax=Larimichthys crocea TaxID=215358 RepID=UPI0009010272|nr:zinc finger protein 687b isoform X1 [Larimichthys crocea]XP_019119839.1 zinc finger protein 687b isoform X1 [Larimichthys crocea]XP_019119840.1 zinc finger protein 687b isoform X1 [Larimichthys crocea]
MGDMKTPDFDDLLAAFDIPDIDAKEAIQSAPDEAEGPHGAAGAPLGKSDNVVGVGSSLRPPSPSDPQADTSIVSVIVKNKVRLEAVDGADGDTDQDPIDVIAGVDVGPRLGACAPGMAESEALNHNGFGASGVSTPLPLSQTQSNGAPWSMNTPKVSSEAAGAAKSHKQGGNIFNRLKPLVAQGSGDPVGRARKMQLLQQQHQQQQDTGQERADGVKASLPSSSSLSAGSSPLAAGGPVGLASPFFPPSKSLLSTPPSALSSHPLHSSQPFNGAPKGGPAGFQHQQMEEDDSDPDLGSPLVIQESPDSPTCTQLSRRYKSDSVSTQPMSSSASHPKPGDTPSGASLTSSTPQSGSTESPQLEDRHPEHVIEERDSPESPEPEMPKSTAQVASKRCSSPAVASTPPPPELREPKEEEEEMEVGNGVERVADGKADKGENARASEEKMEVDDGKSKPLSTDGGEAGVAAATAASGAPSRPLKVRIKTIKTSTGGITRTVTRVAPKGGAAGKGLDPKGQAGERKVLGNKAQKLEASPGHMTTTTSQKVSALNALPVSTLAASSVMLAAATKVQNKMAASDKAKVSATAVSITKSAALPVTPAVASSPKFSVAAGGISVRTATNKTANGGSSTIIGGTLQPNKPASIVNSTGAVISRSQSSLVEAFNKILNSKNLLPSYKPDLSAPPPPEWGLPLPATGYRCLECGDAFALERSLARHYDRRSLRIEVTCNHCAKRLAFFNKCSLLLHAREHKERGLVMQCSHLVMRPVTVEQMIGQQDITPIGGLLTSSSSSPPVSSPSTATGGSAASANSSPMKDASAPAAAQPRPVRRAPQGPQALMPLPCKKAEGLQYNNFKCPECQTQFSSKAELVTHFQQIRAAPNSTCTQCSPPMMLPNSCAVSAHQRIHKHRAPHVCPECGGIARQASFQTHLEEACLHFARRIGYRCSSCQVVFGGLNSIKSHIQTAHCEVFHKCPSCPMAFKSSPSAQSHISTQHPTLTGGQAKMIYKCVMCDTVFTQKPLLYMHFDTHLAKQKVHVFKCPDCTKLYAQKGSMMEHIKTAHRGPSAKQTESQSDASNAASAPANTSGPSGLKSKSSGKPDNSDGEDWGREQEEEEEEEEDDDDDDADEDYEAPGAHTPATGGSTQPPAQTEWTCPQCQTTFTDNDDYLGHVKMEHGKFPCRICGGTFSTSSSLRRHERVIHEGNKRVFHCQYCTEGKRTFGSRFLLDKHIRLHHRSTDGQGPPMTRKRAATGGEGPGSSSEQDGEGGPPVGRTGDEEENATEDGEEGVGPAKRTRASIASTSAAPNELEEEDNVFRCVPCGFSTEDGAEFQRHIPQHRADTASFQCLQCGVCFASAGSLSRHRFITHRVRDTQSDADRGTPRAHGSPDGSPAASPQALGEDGEGNLSCKVCGRRFDKASDLNTHFRTHGMAFLTAHKTDKPQ